MEIQNNLFFQEFLLADFDFFGVSAGKNRQELRINSACLQKRLIIPTIFSEFLQSCSCDQQNLRIIPRWFLRQSFPDSVLCRTLAGAIHGGLYLVTPGHLAGTPDSPKNCREPEGIPATVHRRWPLRPLLSGARKRGVISLKAGRLCPNSGVFLPCHPMKRRRAQYPYRNNSTALQHVQSK